MTIKSGILCTFALSALTGLIAEAGAAVLDRPAFSSRGMVIVWGGTTGGGAPSVNDLYLDNGDGVYSDLISGDVQPVITGTLTPVSESVQSSGLSVAGDVLADGEGVLDAQESLAPFSPDEVISLDYERTVTSSFYVASNVGFSIYAQASIDTANSDASAGLDDIYRIMRVERSGSVDGGSLRFGDAAQYPHSGDHSLAGVVDEMGDYLNSYETEQAVFVGDRGTAAAPGTIADQSVRFTNYYRIPAGLEFHDGAMMITANVIYTVAVP
ncbi:hypothetical protein Q4485_04170 [Granulosicoccaceae sp. 1_MG-2023]|nr:hypothetical protein [Granulosicoccaceae sp. 1_MG-2023]